MKIIGFDVSKGSLIARLGCVICRLGASQVVTGLGLAVVVGVVSGFGAVVFRWLISSCESLFFNGGGQLLAFLGPYYLIVIPVAGGLLVGPLIYLFAREAKGHGVPEVMEAVAVKAGRIRPRVAVVKTLASALCIGSGGSVGREGPIVQIGSSAGSAIGQWLRLPDEHVKTLVACGAAGGISATFNAPIAGIFFALEVILGKVVTPRFAYIAISSVAADFLAQAFQGNGCVFTVPQFGLVSPWEIGFYVVLGIVEAFAAVAFVYLLYRCEDSFAALKVPEYVKPALGGIAIGLIGLYNQDLFGIGYGGIEKALSGHMALEALLLLCLLKIVATSVTIGSGGSGGIFAPSLFIGAMLGSALGCIFHSLFPAITASAGAYGVVGMAALFAGATRAPFSAIFILFEMTGDYAIVLPLMTAVAVSTVLSRAVMRETIYTLKLVRRGIDFQRDGVGDVMQTITVEETMTRGFPTVPSTMRVDDLLALLRKTGHHGFPVLDEERCLVGIATLTDVERSIQREERSLTVADIATKSPLVAYPDQSLYEVLRATEEEYGRIPVVSRDDRRHLVGVLRRYDIIKAYRKKVTNMPVQLGCEVKN